MYRTDSEGLTVSYTPLSVFSSLMFMFRKEGRGERRWMDVKRDGLHVHLRSTSIIQASNIKLLILQVRRNAIKLKPIRRYVLIPASTFSGPFLFHFLHFSVSFLLLRFFLLPVSLPHYKSPIFPISSYALK